MRARKMPVQLGCICLSIVSLGILVFGVVAVLVPIGGDAPLYRANGPTSIGLGLFGGLIVLVLYRRLERWAWCALCFYPVFWAAHLLGNLPSGTDHIHQVVFIALSLIGLVAPAGVFFPARHSPPVP